jgi:hypothetical protein
MRVVVFPAYLRHQTPSTTAVARPVVAEGESSCFFHPTRPAAVACDQCGRLVCTLCDLEVGAEHLCPECLPALDRQGRVEAFERQRTRYDLIVWLLLLLGILSFGTMMAVTGPAALGLALWKWRAPGSRVDQTRLRMASAIPVALAELGLGLWVWMLIAGS